MWDVVALIGLGFCCMLAVGMTAMRLPGPWLILIAALLYDWWADWQPFGWTLLVVVAGMAVAGEVFELIASVVAARKVGASKRAGWGGLIGGFFGMIFLTFLVPIPIVGSVVGALVGCFGGAMLGELSVKRDALQGTKVGLVSAAGMVLGMVAKTAIAFAMSAVILYTAIFLGTVAVP